MLHLAPSTIQAYMELAFDRMSGALDRLDDEKVNARPAGWGTNSVAGLIVHCCELSVFWRSGPGLGRESPRDRDAEFVAVATVAELRHRLDHAREVLEPLIEEFCDGPTAGDHPLRAFLPGADTSDAALVIHIFEELFQHIGHIEVTADALTSTP